ncbi:MAG: hypothetical protein ACYC5M_09965 [Anaerolineae bacterium]
MPIPRYPLTIDGDTWEVGTAAELAVALDVLQGRHDRDVLEQLAPHLPAIVVAPGDLMALFRGLAPPDRVFLIESLSSHLADILGSAGALRDLLATLAEVEVEECLLTTLSAEGLAQLVQSAADLAEVLEWVYGACDRQVLDLLGLPRLRGLLADGSDLSVVLHSLSPAHQAWLLDALGWEQVAALVLTRRDLTLLLRALPGDLSRRLLDHLPGPRLADLIGNPRGWDYLCARLEAGEIAELARRIEEVPHA